MLSLCGIYSTLSLNQYNVSIIDGDNTVKERECTCAKEVAFTKPMHAKENTKLQDK